jgi:hypothetical protein
MCLSKKHVEYLERTNESDFQQGKISYETYVRFSDIVERCRECELCGNNEYGDIQSECRLHFLRVFVSMKRDTEKHLAAKRAAKAANGGAATPDAAVGELVPSMVSGLVPQQAPELVPPPVMVAPEPTARPPATESEAPQAPVEQKSS